MDINNTLDELKEQLGAANKELHGTALWGKVKALDTAVKTSEDYKELQQCRADLKLSQQAIRVAQLKDLIAAKKRRVESN